MLGHIKDVTLTDISNTLQKIISEIHKKLDDPFIIGKCLSKHILTLILINCINYCFSFSSTRWARKLRVEVPLPKKLKKQNNSGLDVSFDSLYESLIESPNNKKYSTSVIVNAGLTFSKPHSSISVDGPVTPVSPPNSHPGKRINVPNLDEGTETKLFNMLSSLHTKVDGMEKIGWVDENMFTFGYKTWYGRGKTEY